MRVFTLVLTVIFIITFSNSATASDEKWEDVLLLQDCPKAAETNLELHECRRAFAMRNISALRQSTLQAMFADIDRNFLLEVLTYDDLNPNNEQYRVISDPALLIASVRSRYSEVIVLAFEANYMIMREAIRKGDEELLASAEQIERRIRLRNQAFGQFCSVFLDDKGCTTVEFGAAYPDHPDLDEVLKRLEIGSAT